MGFAAARVGLGALGVDLRGDDPRPCRRSRSTGVDSPRPLDRDPRPASTSSTAASDHFEFYVFPHTETALCRESRRTDEPPRPRPRAPSTPRRWCSRTGSGGRFALAGRAAAPRRSRGWRGSPRGESAARRKVDRSHRVFASERRIKFTEMEYGIPREHAAEAVRRVLELAARPELGVAFPIEVRFVAADDVILSTAHGRDTCYIAVHQDRRLDWEPYFRAVEEIMDSYGGRPHWGKRHFQTAETLAPLYPRWDEFQALRARLDPEGGSPTPTPTACSAAAPDRGLGPGLEERLALAAVGRHLVDDPLALDQVAAS